MGGKEEFSIKILSSLTKVFPDMDLNEGPICRGSALLNETFSFQIAYWSKKLVKGIKVEAESDLSGEIMVRCVGLAPSELPCYHDHDDIVLRRAPGLYPDPLYPIISEEGLTALPGQWRSLWLTIHLQENERPGIHPIKVTFQTENGNLLGEEHFELEVIPARLPEQTLIHTEWFHTDCLAAIYNVPIFSEEHWQLIAKYARTAVRHGINMILTPLFTPPLDTAVDGERPTVQLVDVEKRDETYSFQFSKLERWIELMRREGIQYFEFSHFFTQWGARHAPKIIIRENGVQKRKFGWDTDAADSEYRDFLSQFFPAIIQFIKQHNLEDKSFFHVSDEPHLEHIESYQRASELIQTYFHEFPIIDALSDYSFYENGLVKIPIPSNDHIEPFLKNEVKNLWTYYCCCQYKKVSNRFFNMPSFRNRVLGMQLYKYEIAGFLHWGYNFWYSQYSKKQINPFTNTDAHYSFPSGDAFLVYPGEKGPIESIRLEVLYEALQDLRALKLLESLIGRGHVLALLEEGLAEEITFSHYPLEMEWYLRKREQINREIKRRI